MNIDDFTITVIVSLLIGFAIGVFTCLLLPGIYRVIRRNTQHPKHLKKTHFEDA